MYQLIRPFLFTFDAEKAHAMVLACLHYVPQFFFTKPKEQPVEAMGMTFAHPIGLAAGCDKNGEHLDALAKLGFSFIEVGTVTPRPQIGNPKPRLFRLPKAQALINRMGFNNQGVDSVIANIQAANYSGILGINIGKNADTSLTDAVNDYVYCMQKVYEQASYITINISSPNTPELRNLQQENYFRTLMSELRDEQLSLSDKYQKYVPLVVKLSPDESDDSLKKMAEIVVALGIDGIIATNTTCDRSGVQGLPYAQEHGGLSGRPLVERSTQCLAVIKQIVGDDVTLIGVGGIDSVGSATKKLNAGASLLQVYTGLIYQGPGLIHKLLVKD